MKKTIAPCHVSLCKPSRILMCYGLFAIFCQLIGLLLSIQAEDPTVSTDVLAHTYLPLLEYPLMSLTLLLSGSLLIDYIWNHNE